MRLLYRRYRHGFLPAAVAAKFALPAAARIALAVVRFALAVARFAAALCASCRRRDCRGLVASALGCSLVPTRGRVCFGLLLLPGFLPDGRLLLHACLLMAGCCCCWPADGWLVLLAC
jgi:hypothetical protein